MKHREALALRRQRLVAHSDALRAQLGRDTRDVHSAVVQGLSLARVGLAAAAVVTGLLALRRQRAVRSPLRLVAGGLKLLPLALGVWRSLQVARRPRATGSADDASHLPHADRSP